MSTDSQTGTAAIILDAEALGHESADQVVGRDKEMSNLEAALAPALRGQSPFHVWCHGPPGSGKTTLARRAVGATDPAGASRLGIHVNCWQHRSLHGVLQAIIDDLKILVAGPRDADLKMDRIRRALRGRPAVVILDDIDRPMPAQREEILLGLLSLPGTALVCIAGGTGALAQLEPGLRSRLSPILVAFPAYSPAQVERILVDRALRALAPGSWSPGILRRIASASGGDARWAIQILRQSAAEAEQAGHSTLSDLLVGHLLQQWQAVHRNQRLTALSEHEKAIYELARRHAPLSRNDLVGRYLAHCQRHAIQPAARRTFTKYLGRLASAGLLTIEGKPPLTGRRIIRAA